MHVLRLVSVAAFAVALSPLAQANSPSGPTLKDRQEAACYNDVQRLCGKAMPDVDKVTDCMKDKRPQVSAKCSALWDVKE